MFSGLREKRTAKRTELANGNFEGFSPEYRIPMDFLSMQWYILDEALSMGRDAELAYEFATTSRLTQRDDKT